jgi:hypothetical protein
MKNAIIYEPENKKHNHGLEGPPGYLFTQAAHHHSAPCQ